MPIFASMDARGQILMQARELFMRYGIRSVTMDDIARELGMSKKTLYQHVPNKTDLIERIIEQHIQQEKACIREFSETARDAIDEILMIARYVIQMLRQMKPTTMFDLKKYYRAIWDKMDRFHSLHTYDVIRRNIERGVAQGYYREQVDADIIAKLYVGKTMFMTDEAMFPMRTYDRDRLFLEFIHYHLRGILSEKGLRQLKKYQPIA